MHRRGAEGAAMDKSDWPSIWNLQQEMIVYFLLLFFITVTGNLMVIEEGRMTSDEWRAKSKKPIANNQRRKAKSVEPTAKS